jgi:hypothetical protein
VKFQVLMAATVLWDTAPCSLTDVNRCFRAVTVSIIRAITDGGGSKHL